MKPKMDTATKTADTEELRAIISSQSCLCILTAVELKHNMNSSKLLKHSQTTLVGRLVNL